MWYLLPPQIKAQDYPSVLTGNWLISFPYLPSAVALMLPLSLMSQTTAFILWMALQVLSFAVVIWTSLRLVGMAQSHLRLPIAAAAVPTWELRAGTLTLSLVLTLMALGTIRMSGEQPAAGLRPV
jgi:hypothetical protein